MFPYACGAISNDRGAHQVTASLLRQSYGIAHALQWLHHEASGADGFFCVHVDLKPANILIEDPVDHVNPVGIWKITDFGISVLREESNQPDPNFVSPLGYMERLTATTLSKRVASTYTAPELNGSGSIVDRGANVWSFGCLLSEVLMFALGRHGLVYEFQNVRQHQTQVAANQAVGDCFYMQQPSNFSAVPNLSDLFILKPRLLDWLWGLPNRHGAGPQQEWLRCCITTILEVLIVDPRRRPSSKEVLSLIEHLSSHFESAKIGNAIPCRYPTTSTVERKSSARSYETHPSSSTESSRRGSKSYLPQNAPSVGSSTPPSAYWRPSIGSDSPGRETLLSSRANSQKAPMSPMSPNFSQPSPISPASEMTLRTRTSSKSSLPSINTTMPPPRGIKVPISNQPPRASLHHLRLQVGRQGSRQNELVDVSKIGKPVEISISPNGELIAYLIKSTVYLFTLDRLRSEVKWANPAVELPTNVSWKQVAIAGDYMVTWGVYDKKKPAEKQVGGQAEISLSRRITHNAQVLFWSLSTRTSVTGPPHSDIASLKAIQVAASGAVAMMCAHCVVYTSVG